MSPRVVVVTKETVWSRLVEEERDARVLALLRKADPTVARLRVANDLHDATKAEVREAVASLGLKATWIEGAHERFDPRDAALVVTVGGDGTLLAASHHVGTTPVLGVNSAPGHSVGFFCGARRGGARRAIASALAGSLGGQLLARMEVRKNGRPISTRVLNDALFCHASPAATSSYIVELDGRSETHKSSGLWIGPAAGSTAAQRSAGGRTLPLGSKRLQLVVREPYRLPGARPRLASVFVADGHELVVRSKMRDAKLFLDGPHDVFDVSLGDTLVFRRSSESLRVLGLSRARLARRG